MDDKTVRGDSDFIPSNMNDDATYRGDNTIISSGMNTPNVNAANFDATVRVGNDTISSGVTNDSNAIIGSGFESEQVKDKDTLELNGKQFKQLKAISLDTGEAEIFLVEGEIEGKTQKAVLKLYKGREKPKEDLIQKLRSFKHEDIIKVYDYGFWQDRFGDRFFELMQYAEGGSVLDHAPIKNVKKIKDIVKETINALDFLHNNGIIHRDIKPENLFYKNSNGTDILLADFGISSITDTRVSHHRTTKMGSDLYIAPEGLRSNSLRSSKVTISKSLDYYSLGITLIVAWMGRDKFDKMLADIAGDDNKEDLIATWNDVKELGKIPLPDDMPEEIKTLIKGLTVINEEKRWSHNECTRWLKGEDVPVYKDVLISEYKPFAFDDDKIARTPEEFAQFMQEDEVLAEKYLFRGKITEWLKDAKNNKLAVLVEDLYESEFKKNKKAAVQAAIYLLNPKLPYIADDGTKCNSITELAVVVENDKDEYAKRLKSKDDTMYLFIESRGEKELADYLRSFFKKYKDNDQLAITYVIYALDPTKPFLFQHKKDKNGNTYTLIERDKIKKFAPLMFNQPEESKDYVLSEQIEAWLSFGDDQNTYDWVKYLREEIGKKNRDAMLFAIAVAFDPKMLYAATDGTTCYTKEEFASAMMKNFDKYANILTNENSNFYMWALVKRWDWELNLTKFCFTPKNHKNKLFPYNNNIALMKVIKALGNKIPYVIEGKTFNEPNELLNADSSVKNFVKKELKDLGSKTHAWLSVFFHEDPFVKFNKKGDYEDKLKEYMDFIEKISPDNELTKRYNKAVNSLPKKIQNEKSADIRFQIGRVIAVIIPMIAGILLFRYVYPDGGTTNLPGAFWNLPQWYYLVFGILGVILVFAGGEGGISTGCIGGPIVGAIAGVILYYVFYFVLSSWIITAALIIGVFGYALYTMLQEGTYGDKFLREQLYDMSDKLTFEWEPLAFAFSNKTVFESSRAQKLETYHANRKSAKLTVFMYSAIPSFVFFAVLVLLLSFDKNYDADFAAVKEFIKSIYSTIVNLF